MVRPVFVALHSEVLEPSTDDGVTFVVEGRELSLTFDGPERFRIQAGRVKNLRFSRLPGRTREARDPPHRAATKVLEPEATFRSVPESRSPLAGTAAVFTTMATDRSRSSE